MECLRVTILGTFLLHCHVEPGEQSSTVSERDNENSGVPAFGGNKVTT